MEYNPKTGEWESELSRTSFGFSKENLFTKIKEEYKRFAAMTDEEKANWMENEIRFQERQKMEYFY